VQKKKSLQPPFFYNLQKNGDRGKKILNFDGFEYIIINGRNLIFVNFL